MGLIGLYQKRFITLFNSVENSSLRDGINMELQGDFNLDIFAILIMPIQRGPRFVLFAAEILGFLSKNEASINEEGLIQSSESLLRKAKRIAEFMSSIVDLLGKDSSDEVLQCAILKSEELIKELNPIISEEMDKSFAIHDKLQPKPQPANSADVRRQETMKLTQLVDELNSKLSRKFTALSPSEPPPLPPRDIPPLHRRDHDTPPPLPPRDIDDAPPLSSYNIEENFIILDCKKDKQESNKPGSRWDNARGIAMDLSDQYSRNEKQRIINVLEGLTHDPEKFKNVALQNKNKLNTPDPESNTCKKYGNRCKNTVFFGQEKDTTKSWRYVLDLAKRNGISLDDKNCGSQPGKK